MRDQREPWPAPDTRLRSGPKYRRFSRRPVKEPDRWKMD